MGILIDCVRIANFRAIKNLEVNLSPLTVLVGANNSGKTSFLRALHLALGFDRRTVTREDVHDDGVTDPDTLDIIVDVRIVSVDVNGKRQKEFEDSWAESDGFSGQIKSDENDFSLLAFRTRFKFDMLSQTYKPEVKALKQWLKFEEWQNPGNEDKRASKLESIPLIFIDAQRDIQNDLRDKNSFLGKLTNKPDIGSETIKEIEGQINQLNEQIIAESPKLKHLKNKLLELNKTVNSQGDGVEIMPVNRHIRDIGRNLNINFKDTNAQSFPLEYHGMGTRSWASLLTLNAYLSWQEETNNPYFPILALEEPEAHLHPNAQRQLYHQLANIKGQKIISTHSPFVAAQCDLMNLRHFHRDDKGLKVGQLKIKKTDLDNGITNSIVGKLNYFVLQSRGELIFSKAIVLMEGATEEQSLPIMYFAKFGSHPFESGVNFISVGGKDYLPYLAIANFLNINWYILSDGDRNSENEVKAQIDQLAIQNYEDILFILGKVDFEEYLLDNDYVKELISAINNYKNGNYFPDEFIEEYDQQKMKGGMVRNYKSDHDGGIRRALLDCLRKNKFDFAKPIAHEISNKKGPDGRAILPPKIEALFNKIAHDINIPLP
jgi:putative ATP-dependent endonuclease of OLD family